MDSEQRERCSLCASPQRCSTSACSCQNSPFRSNKPQAAAATATAASATTDDSKQTVVQKKSNAENLAKTFRFLKRVSTDISIWKSKSGVKAQNSFSRQCSSNDKCGRSSLHNSPAACRAVPLCQSGHSSPACDSAASRSSYSCNAITPRYARCLAEFRPSASQIHNWSNSFQALLNHPCGLAMFREFLRSEFSDENIDFWIACKQYSQGQQDDGQLMRHRAQNLFEQFLKDQASKEVNLDSETRQKIVSRFEADQIDMLTFTEAQQRIYTLMEKDSYRRFLQSDVYRQATQEYCKNLSDDYDTSDYAI